jgi:hypothetical protein
VIVYTEPRTANSQPRRANSQLRLRDATRSPRAPFANGRRFAQSAGFGCLRFQLSTVDSRLPLGSCPAPKAQKRAPATPLCATRLPRSVSGTDSLSRESFLPRYSRGPCRSCANTRGVGISTSIFRSRFGTPDCTRDTKSLKFCALAFAGAKSFRIRSYGKCAGNSFRIRSYKIPRGVESPCHLLAPLLLTEGTATKGSSSQSADTSSATRAYPVHPISIARSGVQVHG